MFVKGKRGPDIESMNESINESINRDIYISLTFFYWLAIGATEKSFL